MTSVRTTGGDNWRTGNLAHGALLALSAEVERQLAAPLSEVTARGKLAYASIDRLEYPADESQASGLWQEGKTAVLQSLQAQAGLVNLACARMEVAEGRRVSCSAYLAAASAKSFGFHVDEWDAHIVQLRGRKTFELRPEQTDAVVSVELEPGTVLFLPQGLPHRAHSAQGSLHVSFNLLPVAVD